MKLPLTIILVCVLINVSEAGVLLTSVNNMVNDVFGFVKGTTSNAAHAGCRAFAEFVKEHPINPPHIKEVSFQFRTPCGQKEFPVRETAKFRKVPEFDANKNTVVFVTGWFATPDKDYVDDMAKAYHCRGGYNFVIVNTGGSITNLYVQSAYHTGRLGEFVAIGLQNLGIPVEKIHLIGHSLGAHIVGSAGRHFHKLTGQKLVRLTGLDPARPCFMTPVVFPRLRRSDANFVDIIHSNPTDIGTEEPIGDADFYPGGLEVIKPGCGKLSFVCSHELSIQYYTESVYPGNEKHFMGALCSNYSDLKENKCFGPRSPMGYASDVQSKGIHYLSVRDKSPYGMDAKTAATFRSDKCGRCPMWV